MPVSSDKYYKPEEAKYKVVADDIQRQKIGFTAAKDNPQEYLKAILKAKMDGKIK